MRNSLLQVDCALFFFPRAGALPLRSIFYYLLELVQQKCITPGSPGNSRVYTDLKMGWNTWKPATDIFDLIVRGYLSIVLEYRIR